MSRRAYRAIDRHAAADCENHRADNLQLAVPIEGETLQVVNRWCRRARHTEDKSAGAVGDEAPVGPGGHCDLADAAIERQVADRGKIARALAGGIERDIARASRRRWCVDDRHRNRVSVPHQAVDEHIPVEGDHIAGG